MSDRLARGWDEAADGYEAYWVPRFAPWVDTAARAVVGEALPGGPVLVPCCGTFPELEPLTAALPRREIVGIDLSAGMVRLANGRAARYPHARAVQGDASTVDAGSCAALVSVFGLQQLPQPDAAIGSWVAALRPGGVLSVVYWAGDTETDGPFALLFDVMRAHVPPPDRSWESRIAAAVTAHGGVVHRDASVAHPMSHADAATFLDAYTSSGPHRPLADAPFFEAVRAEFLRRAPVGEWSHRPQARHLVVSV
jgi:SAM-dependent methyltransferase